VKTLTGLLALRVAKRAAVLSEDSRRTESNYGQRRWSKLN